MKTSVPLVPRVRMVALVLIHHQAVLLVIVLEPGILEPRVKLVNTVELHISNLYNVLGMGFNIDFFCHQACCNHMLKCSTVCEYCRQSWVARSN